MTTAATTKATVQSLANDAFAFFEQRTRENGKTFWCCKDETPQWVKDLVYNAHGDFGPDDWRYEFIWEALSALSCLDEDDDPEVLVLEADIYTGELTGWLHSNLQRIGYVDEAVDEYGGASTFDGITNMIMAGQASEKREVLQSVIAFLSERAEELNAEIEETDDEE